MDHFIDFLRASDFFRSLAVGALVAPAVLLARSLIMKRILKGRYGAFESIAFMISLIVISVLVPMLSRSGA